MIAIVAVRLFVFVILVASTAVIAIRADFDYYTPSKPPVSVPPKKATPKATTSVSRWPASSVSKSSTPIKIGTNKFRSGNGNEGIIAQGGLKKLVDVVMQYLSIGGTLFSAFQISREVYDWIRRRQGTFPRSRRGVEFGRSGDHHVDGVDGNNSSQAASSSTASLSDLQQEQEEIWRVVHNIYKGHAEKLTALEAKVHQMKAADSGTGSSGEGRKDLTRTGGESKNDVSTYTMALTKLSTRLDNLENAGDALDRKTGAAMVTLQQQIRIESEKHTAALESLKREAELHQGTSTEALRREMNSVLQKHDESILIKLKEFGEEVKSILKSSGSSKASTTKPVASSKKKKN